RHDPTIRVGARLLLAMIRQACGLVGVLNPDGTVEFGLGERILGYPEEELVGRFPLHLIHPDDLEEATLRLVDGVAPPGPTEPFECRLRHADGTWRWFEVIGTNLRDE